MSTAPETPRTDEQAEPRSPYWLRPGIDVPFRHPESLCPTKEARRLLFIDTDSGEAGFVPTEAFMKESALWRLDVLGDISNDIKLVQEHATVELFRHVYRRNPGRALADYIAHFDRLFEGMLGVALAENWRDLLSLDYEDMSKQAGAAQPAGEAVSSAPTV
jgi:hypothetical protein